MKYFSDFVRKFYRLGYSGGARNTLSNSDSRSFFIGWLSQGAARDLPNVVDFLIGAAGQQYIQVGAAISPGRGADRVANARLGWQHRQVGAPDLLQFQIVVVGVAGTCQPNETGPPPERFS